MGLSQKYLTRIRQFALGSYESLERLESKTGKGSFFKVSSDGQRSMGERSEHAHLQKWLSDLSIHFLALCPLLTGCSTIKGDVQNQSSETVLEGRTGGSSKNV